MALPIRKIRRKISRTVRPWHFKEAYVNQALEGRERPVYLEIGVHKGASMRQVRASLKIGVDPNRQPEMQVLRAREVFFEMPSDEFFESHVESALGGRKIDVALVDGLHEFEQTLRDIWNLERYMAPDGLIVIDDCNPPTAASATEIQGVGSWHGDVWKVAEYLRRERPDLRYATINADEGVGVVRGFGSPGAWPDPATLARYKALPYSVLERDRVEVLRLVAAGPAAIDQV